MIPTGASIVGNTRRRVLRPDKRRHHLFPLPALVTRILFRTSPPLHDFPTAHVEKSVYSRAIDYQARDAVSIRKPSLFISCVSAHRILEAPCVRNKPICRPETSTSFSQSTRSICKLGITTYIARDFYVHRHSHSNDNTTNTRAEIY